MLVLCLPAILGITNALAQTSFWQHTGPLGGGEVFKIASSPVNGFIFAATRDSGIYRSTNNGASWTKTTRLYPPEAIQRTWAAFVNRLGIVFATREGSTTSNGGVFWTSDNGNIWQIATGSYGSWVDILEDTSDNLFAGGNTLIKSNDGGLNWFPSAVGISHPIRSLASNSINYLFAGTAGGGVYRSTNSGIIWIQTMLSTLDVKGLATQPGGIVYAATEGQGIWKSTDNGSNWDTTGTGYTGTPRFTSIVISTAGEIFAGAILTGGVIKSTDAGASWQALNSGLTDSSVNCLTLASNGFLYAGTSSGLVFRSVQPITSIPGGSEIAQDFILSQNYPNPFNPSTTIQFSLARSEFATLKVFNILGEQIATLVSKNLSAGIHQVQWNAEGSPSGVYFYRLQAGSFSQTKKLLLLR